MRTIILFNFCIIINLFITFSSALFDCRPSPVVKLVENWKPLLIFAEFDPVLLTEGKEFIAFNCWIPVLENYWSELIELQRLGNPVILDKDISDTISLQQTNYNLKYNKMIAIILYPMPTKDPEELSNSILQLLKRIETKEIDPTYLFIHIEMLPKGGYDHLDKWIEAWNKIQPQIFFIVEGIPYVLDCSKCRILAKNLLPLINRRYEPLYTQDEIEKMSTIYPSKEAILKRIMEET